MKKIIKIALPIIACLAIAFGVISVNKIASNANYPDDFTITFEPNIDDYAVKIDETWEASTDYPTYKQTAICSNDNFELPVCEYWNDEKLFVGWGTSSSLNSLIESETINVNGDTTLYALWDDFKLSGEPNVTNDYTVSSNLSSLEPGFNMTCAMLFSLLDKEQQLQGDQQEFCVVCMEGIEDNTEITFEFNNITNVDNISFGDSFECVDDNVVTITLNAGDMMRYCAINAAVDQEFIEGTTCKITCNKENVYISQAEDNVPKFSCVTVTDTKNICFTGVEDGKRYMYAIEHVSLPCGQPLIGYKMGEFIGGEVKVAKSSSKKYKAKTTTDNGEKISGTGKKNSTRTITPVEGKKVQDVIVTDKDGNIIDVTLNEDGTYSFKQPASNVDVQIVYKNREITLNMGSTNIDVDGDKTNVGVAPVVRNNRTMLPIRCIAENLGAKVGWEEKNPNVVTITKGDTTIVIHLGSNKVEVNGNEFEIDAVAFAENDRTYLPVRFVSEQLNAEVIWDEVNPSEIVIKEK